MSELDSSGLKDGHIEGKTFPFPETARQVAQGVVFIEKDSKEGCQEGTGFIIDSAGYIATAKHCVKDAALVRVKLNDSEDFLPAEVIGTSEPLDVAITKVAHDFNSEPRRLLSLLDTVDLVAVGTEIAYVDTAMALTSMGSPFFRPTRGTSVLSVVRMFCGSYHRRLRLRLAQSICTWGRRHSSTLTGK